MIDLIAVCARPPQFGRDVPWERHRQIGLLIDWLDSRPEHASRDTPALQRIAKRGDIVAQAAAVISGRLDRAWLELDGPADHQIEYRPYYHTDIAGYLQGAELDLGEQTYRRLNQVHPECVSGLFNLAELSRRRGQETEAFALLRKALDCASTAVTRYGVANTAWSLDIRCALTRLGRDVGEGEPLLDNASRERITDLIAQLRTYGSGERAAIPAHQAFSVASAEQRIVLHAAMRLAHVWPSPPPAAHSDFADIRAVDEIVKQLTPNAQPPVPRGRPGPLASLILWIARRLDG